MQARVEVVELGDPVQDVGDQLAQEDPRCDADLPAQLPGYRGGQVRDVGVIDERSDPGRVPRRGRPRTRRGSRCRAWRAWAGRSPVSRSCTARGESNRGSVPKSVASRWASGVSRATPCGPS